MYSKQDIIQILIDRDGESHEVATILVDDVAAQIASDPDSAQEIIHEELGLEMDYIEAFL